MKIVNVLLRARYALLAGVMFFLLQVDILNAQTIPVPNFDFCDGVPTENNIAELNRYLAYTHGPVLHLRIGNIRFDIPQTIDFDSDLHSIGNWVSARFEASLTPTVYYAVLWTETKFVITYSLFYPRDYKDNLAIVDCLNIGEHENDLERIVILVDRCSGEAAALVTHHGRSSTDLCIDDKVYVADGTSIPSGVQPGNHLEVYASEGSHAIWFTPEEAVCDATEIDDTDICAGVCTDFSYSHVYYPIPDIANSPDIGYVLIDIFDETNGIWHRRNNLDLFNQSTDYSDQRFNGRFGGRDDAAAAPWNGRLGFNPIQRIVPEPFRFQLMGCSYVQQIHDGESWQDVENPNPFQICESYDINPNESYIYNPYKCDEFDFDLESDIEGMVCEGDEITVSILLNDQCFNRPIKPVWSASPSIFDIECIAGCDELTATFKLNNTSVIGEEFFTIRATFETPDCGNVAKSITLRYKPTTPRDVDDEDMIFPSELCTSVGGEVVHYDLSVLGYRNPGWTFQFKPCDGDRPHVSYNLLELIVFLDVGENLEVCWEATSICGILAEGSFTVTGINCGEERVTQGSGEIPNAIEVSQAETITHEATSNEGINTAQPEINLDQTDVPYSMVQISPNPFTNQLVVQLSPAKSEVMNRLLITDIHGRVLMHFALNNSAPLREVIDVSMLPEGLYFLSVETNKGIITNKISKVNY